MRFVKAVDAHHYKYYFTITNNNKVNYCSCVPVKASTEELLSSGRSIPSCQRWVSPFLLKPLEDCNGWENISVQCFAWYLYCHSMKIFCTTSLAQRQMFREYVNGLLKRRPFTTKNRGERPREKYNRLQTIVLSSCTPGRLSEVSSQWTCSVGYIDNLVLQI